MRKTVFLFLVIPVLLSFIYCDTAEGEPKAIISSSSMPCPNIADAKHNIDHTDKHQMNPLVVARAEQKNIPDELLSRTDWDAPLEKESGLTSKKLLSSVFKGIREDPESVDLVTVSEKALRVPGSKERTVLPEGTRFTSFKAIRVRGDGRRYLVMFWDTESNAGAPNFGASVIAIFAEDSAEPLDVANVKSTDFCSLGNRLSLGPDDAFTIDNSHSNSSQSYFHTDMFHIHDGRIKRIASVPMLSIQAGCEDSFDETLTWRTEPDAGSPYLKVVATVTLIKRPGEYERDSGNCPKSKKSWRKEVFMETYRWNNAKKQYVGPIKPFERLKRFNEKNF
ncbi:MAG: hypothetical protein ACYDGO_06985 [Smithellaceae bacterium]